MYHSIQNSKGITLAELKEFIDKHFNDCGHLSINLTDEMGEVNKCVSIIVDENDATFYTW